MREEALQRLREMQRRSRSMVSAPGDSFGSAPDGALQSAPGSIRQPGAEAGRANTDSSGSLTTVSEIIKSILGSAGRIDSDGLLILLMLFAMYRNKADIKLLAALGYILI